MFITALRMDRGTSQDSTLLLSGVLPSKDVWPAVMPVDTVQWVIGR